VKALTICQPYAELIVVGDKRVENRKWSTRYRGPLVIHAGMSRAWLTLKKQPPTYEGGPDMSYDVPSGIYLDAMDFGAIIGTVDMIDCLHIDEIESGACDERYDWIRAHAHSNGPWCHVYANARRLPKPIPYRGKQGFFNVPGELLEAQKAVSHV
jgi:hypothetical protein